MPAGKRAEIAEKTSEDEGRAAVFKRPGGNLVLIPTLRENYSYCYLHEKLQTNQRRNVSKLMFMTDDALCRAA